MDSGRGAFEQTEPFAYFLAAPVHQQAKDIFWERLKRDTRLVRSKVPSESELKVTLVNGCTIKVVGLDKPERIEGQTDPPVKGIHITEMGNMKDDVWGSHVYPILADTNGFAIIDGVPEGRNHYYDMALSACGGAIPPTVPKQGAYGEDGEWSFHTWFSSDVLDKKIIRDARKHLDPRTFRQEFEGSFEDYEGLLYWAFGPHNFSDVGYDPKHVVHIGMDFNVNPMTATFCHILKKHVFQFGEAYLNHSNTIEMAEHLKRLFSANMCIVYPDATGDFEHSNATKSDLTILRQAGFEVKAPGRRNPYVRDRIQSVNSMLRTDSGLARYHINKEKCPMTLRDLNRVESTSDGRENKKQEAEGMVHISSALGYFIDFNFPARENIYLEV